MAGKLCPAESVPGGRLPGRVVPSRAGKKRKPPAPVQGKQAASNIKTHMNTTTASEEKQVEDPHREKESHQGQPEASSETISDQVQAGRADGLRECDRDQASEPEAAGLVLGTPLTNRGSLKPKGYRTDYLVSTVFCDAETLKDAVMPVLVSNTPAGTVNGWVEKGPGNRIRERWEALPGVSVMLPSDEKADYSRLEIKGQGREALGEAALGEIFKAVGSLGVRWHVTRIDLTWDDVPFTVQDVYEASLRGDVLSSKRAFAGGKDGTVLYKSGSGDTVYLGFVSEKNGEKQINRKACALLRVYDRRGPVRLELELKHDAAKAAGLMMLLGVEDREKEARVWLRHCVEFVDSGKDARIGRCPLLPWWSEFVGDTPRTKPLRPVKESLSRESAGPRLLGKYEGQHKRNRVWIKMQRKAMGDKCFLEANDRHFKNYRYRLSEEDREAFDKKFAALVEQYSRELRSNFVPGLLGLSELPLEVFNQNEPPF